MIWVGRVGGGCKLAALFSTITTTATPMKIISTEQGEPRPQTKMKITILKQVAIGGEKVKPDTDLEVGEGLAKELIARGAAKPYAPKPAKAAKPGKPGEE